MKLTKEAVRTMLAVELNKVGCTLVDAEQFIKTAEGAALVKTAWDPFGAIKAMANLGGGSALALGAAGGLTGYGLYSSVKDSDSKERKKLVEIDQYRQALKDLQAAQQQHPGM